MKIDKITIDGYGKLLNKTFSFPKGITLVYGKNETGKSTLQSFITNMLFGFENKNKDSEGRLPDLKKYEPWNHDRYSGSIEVTLDNLKKIKVERNFATKECHIYNEHIEDITASYDYTKREGVLFGESLFSMNKNTFMNTALIKQSRTQVFKNDNQEIFDKIINLQESGDESLSVSKTIKAIESAKRELGHKNTKNRLYNLAVSKLEKINQKLIITKQKREKILQDQDKKRLLRKDIEEITVQIDNLREKVKANEDNEQAKRLLEKINKLKKTKTAYSEYEEKMKKISQDILDIDENISEFQKLSKIKEEQIMAQLQELSSLKSDFALLESKERQEQLTLSQTKNISKKTITIVMLFLLLTCTILGLLISPFLYIGTVLALIELLYQVVLKRNKPQVIVKSNLSEEKQILAKRQLKVHSFILETGYICENNLVSMEQLVSLLFKQKNQLQKLQHSKDIKENSKKENTTFQHNLLIQAGYEKLIDLINEIKVLQEKYQMFKRVPEEEENIDYKHIMEESKLEFQKAKQELAGVNAVINEYWTSDDKLAELVEEQNKYQEKLNEISQSQQALTYAITALEEAAKKVKFEVIPKINEKMGKYLTAITNEEHNNLLTGKDSQLNSTYDNQVRSIWQFSDGTIDQMYLALRIAATEVFSKQETLPILLDEIFAFYDQERISNCFSLLCELAKKHQIIVFTCKEEEKHLAERFSEITIMNLS